MGAWHGGRAYFAEFSEEAIGTGEGDALGWGFYFSEHRKGGEYFAEYLNFRDGAGFLYEVQLELAEEEILNLDLPFLKNLPQVRSRISKVFRGKEMSYGLNAAYRVLRDEFGDEGAARELRSVGITAVISDEQTKPAHGRTVVVLDKKRIAPIQVFRFSKNPYEWCPLPIPQNT